ncbi:Oidioi.mRNA.OKI2018_I69.chr2.g7943.t1.cds [Oikopleura dioica]|uniref:Oidioi.mRNA.OKI2018_I69.chr2.g7943.t1.cds n=1 Tax=Oikopleura dioica TaxID=34765 RepID=A0ABN7T892_OIKDI|nr:Oidioi.mRNA.OKI2018_I69.chr2.g7943.t1.cds [Oikopleura dioica]
MKFLAPEKLRGYVKTLWEKHKIGQPVSFTDIFGTMIGESLLGKHNLKARLSDMTRHCDAGENPLPIMVAVVVKPKESAIKYHEWVEFTPFEIGVPKYGTFMKPENFGSEFFMGSIVQKFEEFPLHFLQGLWGSAFSILIHRVLDPKSPAMKESETEEMNQIIQEENVGTNSDEDMPRRRSTGKGSD